MNRKLTKEMFSITNMILIFGILILLNMIGVELFARLDLTEGNIYSLTKATKKLIKQLDDRLIIRCYFTDDMPPPYNQNIRYLKTLLEGYKTFSHNKIQFEFVDPLNNPALEKEAQRFGIPPLQINVMKDDRMEIKKVYMGIAFLYEDKREIIPVLQNISNLEYDISTIINRLTRKEQKVIGFSALNGEAHLKDELSIITNALGKHYYIREIDLSEGLATLNKVDVLVIMSPIISFNEWKRFVIDQYIMSGGKVVFMIDTCIPNIEQGQAPEIDVGLEQLFELYGVKINNNLIIDNHCVTLTVAQQTSNMIIRNMVNYPYIPMIKKFNKQNQIVKDLERLTLPFVSSIDTTLGNSDSLYIEPLFWSSRESGITAPPYNVNPLQKFNQRRFTDGNKLLGIVISGIFPSYYADKPIPSEDVNETGLKIRELMLAGEVLDKSPETRIVIIADGDMVKDEWIKNTGNSIFFLNMLDWLCQENSFIQIRSRGITDRSLKALSKGKRNFGLKIFP